MKKIRGIFLIAAVALVSFLVAGCITQHDDYPDVVDIVGKGDLLPDFEVTMNDGSRVSTADLAGRRSLVVLFNTGCPDCRRELPVIQSVYDAAGDNFTLLCIAREEEAASIAAYWEANGLTMPYSPQADRRIFNLFATESIPRVYVADASLRIVAAFTDDSRPLSRDSILSLLE